MQDAPRLSKSISGARAPVLRRHVLREALPETVRLLDSCGAQQIQAGFLDDYVALDWLEWRGGALKLTVVGEKICEQITRRA